jgi:hypothetical protein
VLAWEEVNKLIELIKKEGEVYHMARWDNGNDPYLGVRVPPEAGGAEFG